MVRKSLPGLILILSLLLAGCSAAKSTNQVAVYPEMDSGMGAPAEAPMMERELASSSEMYQSAPDSVERLVIRNATLSIVVAEPGDVADVIAEMASEMGGFVVNSNIYQRQIDGGVQVMEATITVRVPVEKLDEALKQIKSLVKNPETDVLNENVTGQDVTQDYTDLQSRLRNLEDAAEQLRKIMDTATKPEDVLQIFNELKQVNEQIEILKGQIQYYEESAAMSAISVTLQAEESVAPLTIGSWKPQGVARDALQALIEAYQFIANAAIWLVVFCLPIGLPIGLVVFFIVRAVVRARKKRKAAAAVESSQDSTPAA